MIELLLRLAIQAVFDTRELTQQDFALCGPAR